MKNILFTSIYAFSAAVAATVLITQPILAISVNKDYVERGVTQFDELATGEKCGDTGSSTSGGAINLGSTPTERRVNLIKVFMSTYGLTAAQAAGIVGNFAHEAGNYGGNDAGAVRPDVNQGTSTGAPPAPGGLGYGWAQWSGGRKTNFVNFLEDHPEWTDAGKATDTANFNFLKGELTDSYQSTIAALKRTSSPREAAISFEETFERAGVPAIAERVRWAETAHQEYLDGGGNAGGLLSSCGGGVGTGTSANFGAIAFPLSGTKKVVLNPGMFHDGDADLGGHPYIAYDILAKPGTEVVAFASGRVTYVSKDKCPGNFVTIWNEQAKLGVSYMHLGSHISEGTRVEAGDHVGVVGPASAGCGIAHLHIDVATDRIRQACARESCSIQDHFRSIGRDLYNTYQALPDS